MEKRERLEKAIAGEQVDRIPVSLWRHWPGDDQRAADLAHAVLAFQETYDWDFVNIMPANNFLVADYGIQDHWGGEADGTRKTLKYVVNRSLDWTELRAIDPARGAIGRHMECLRLIESGLEGKNTPYIQTIFNPFSQACLLAGTDVVIRHMRTNPDRLQTGLNAITETTLRFIEALKRTSISGIYFVVEHANYDMLSAEEYQTFGLPYDRKLLDTLPNRWWLNILNMRGKAPMFRFIDHYPVSVMNWEDYEGEPDLARGKSLVRGAVCGGLSAYDHVHYGTPASIRDAARKAITQVNARRFILSTGLPLLVSSPLSNLRAVCEVAKQAGV